jgi:hypothetical protein
MPLLDHFRSSWSADWPWDGVHANWATKIADHLNSGLLPSDYHAISLIKRGGQVEIDVATLHHEGDLSSSGASMATAAWAPPLPAAVAPIEFPEEELFEVQVLRRFGGARLRAAIELVSPANKDRPSSRHAFAVKCASYLYEGIAVMIIDVVTERLSNLHAEFMQLLHVNGGLPWQSPTHLYAVAYRVVPAQPPLLENWRESLALGSPLPTLPLWLEPDLSVPVRLEESYRAMCRSLRIPGVQSEG